MEDQPLASWSFQESKKKWRDINPSASAEIEAAYRISSTATLTVTINGNEHLINLRKMTSMRAFDSTAKNIKRTQREGKSSFTSQKAASSACAACPHTGTVLVPHWSCCGDFTPGSVRCCPTVNTNLADPLEPYTAPKSSVSRIVERPCGFNVAEALKVQFSFSENDKMVNSPSGPVVAFGDQRISASDPPGTVLEWVIGTYLP